MKIFISWSGTRSQSLAQILREWLPLVLDYVEPWVSETDIAAGDRWAQAIGSELESSNFGIICITPENLTSPWVLFEAGALSKSMQDSKVIPLLLGLEYSDIGDPLAQFQAKKVDQVGLGEVIQAIEKVSDNKNREELIRRRFNGLWADFEKMIEEIPDRAPTEKHMRPQTEILEELVTSVRGLDSRLQDFSIENLEKEPTRRRRRIPRFHPVRLREYIHSISGQDNDPIILIMIGGLVRDEFPWLAELLIETYRQLKEGPSDQAQASIRRLQRVLHTMADGGFAEDFFMDGSKDAWRLARDLPMIIDEALHHYLMPPPPQIVRKVSMDRVEALDDDGIEE